MVSVSTISRSRSLAFATARMAVERGLFCQWAAVSVFHGFESGKRTVIKSRRASSYLVGVELAESHLCVGFLSDK